MHLNKEYWQTHEVWHGHWWFLVLSSLATLVIWWIFADKDKSRFPHIFCYGLLCSLASFSLDTTGVLMNFWAYPHKVLFMIPSSVPADLVVIPVSGMLIFQYFPRWKAFIPAAIALSAIFSFIIEPSFIKFDLFMLIKWRHTYSFIGFILLFTALKGILQLIWRQLRNGDSKKSDVPRL